MIPGLGISPGGGNGNPFQYSCLENGRRSLVGYSPWGRKESDTTEQLHFTSYWWISQNIFVFWILQAICQLFLPSGFILVLTVAPVNLMWFFFPLLAALNIYFPFVFTNFTITIPGCFMFVSSLKFIVIFEYIVFKCWIIF